MTEFTNNNIHSLDEISETQTPDIKTLKFHKVHSDYLSIVILSYIIAAPILLILNVCAFVFIEPIVGSISLLVWIPYLLLILWNIAYVKSLEYALREHDISLYSGVLFKRTVIQPYTRLQHIEIKRGPLERRKNLASLALFSAGGANHALEIKGLLESDAEKIKQFILKHKDLKNG